VWPPNVPGDRHAELIEKVGELALGIEASAGRLA
jgi:hypothetical protein